MDDKIYKQSFDTAIDELSNLMSQLEEIEGQREELKSRSTFVRKGILALSSLLGKEPRSVQNEFPHLFPDLITPDTGLTDAVRKVLKSSNKLLTPVGVRTELKSTGYDIERYKNILASIHTILKRLVEADEVSTGMVDDVTAYQWKSKPEVKVNMSKLPVRVMPKKPTTVSINETSFDNLRKFFTPPTEKDK